ncbi:hypothetical protein [Mucilaginibacter sp. UYCu711]|uniref:hypothetical protein n=1 Tax=Mucilaginibacter sp. UYCu711 TaxID=3156339 RepID=UPI003D246DD5
MLHQISWFTYTVSILSLVIIYYAYVGLTFYRVEILATFYRLTGRQPAFEASSKGDLQIPDYDIMGKAQPDDVDFVNAEELSFGPADVQDELQSDQATKVIIPAGSDSRLIGDFSEMVSEAKTLIRVINESSESKENFEMLFRLIIQKYPALTGTAYQQQINNFLLSEGVPQFPFSLTLTDLENYWTNEN